MKKIVVTGHKGFIGSEIFFRLQMLGLQPIGIDLKDGKDILDGVPENDITVHCAAKLSGKDVFNYNTLLTQAVIKNTKRIIFLSSAAVYGNVKHSVVEIQPFAPINDYGSSKVNCEKLIENKMKRYTILRLSNVYGVRSNHGVISQFLRGKKTIYGDGNQVRDFVPVEQVADEAVDAVTHPTYWQGVFNISSGKGTKIIDLFHRFYPDEEPTLLTAKKEIRYSVLKPYYL